MIQSKPANCQVEPPYPDDTTVIFSIRNPEHTAHLPSNLCAVQEPHPVTECGEWRLVYQRPGFTAFEKSCVVGSARSRYEKNYERIFGAAVATDASDSPLKLNSMPQNTAKYPPEAEQ